MAAEAVRRRAMLRGVCAGCLAAALRPGGARAAGGRLLAPVPATCVTSPFGPRILPGEHVAEFHKGVDLRAPVGTWVRAAAAGEVLQIRRLDYYGLVVDLLHRPSQGPDFVTRYAHLGTIAPAFETGRRVAADGARLGRIGRTGITYGPHLHFEVHLNDAPVDPEPWLAVARCLERTSSL